MASLRQVIKDYRGEICDGIAWVAIYKDGRSWNASAFYPEDGDYEDGFVFDRDDYEEMQRIAGVDHKAICVNGYYQPFGEDFTLDEIENKVLYFYEMRFNQLRSDFLECFVVPPAELGSAELGEVVGIKVSACPASGGAALYSEIYSTMSQAEALAQFRLEHPEYEGCILMAENVRSVGGMIDGARIASEETVSLAAEKSEHEIALG